MKIKVIKKDAGKVESEKVETAKENVTLQRQTVKNWIIETRQVKANALKDARQAFFGQLQAF